MAISLNHEEILTPPVLAATVIVLRDAPGGLEVLMVRRHGDSGVFGGVHVFPGGKLDEADRRTDPARLDRTPEQLHAALDEPELDLSTALGLHVAALRETWEEVGLLLGLPPAAPRDFATGPLPVGALLPWSRWITPRVPSVSNRRFDTRFFLSVAPEGQEAAHDDHEATEAVWVSPREGLRRYWHQEIEMAPPQIMTLMELSRVAGVAEALASARARRPPVIQPHSMEVAGERVVCYPGDPDHPVPQAVWNGPLRMTYRNRRFEPEGGLEALLG